MRPLALSLSRRSAAQVELLRSCSYPYSSSEQENKSIQPTHHSSIDRDHHNDGLIINFITPQISTIELTDRSHPSTYTPGEIIWLPD